MRRPTISTPLRSLLTALALALGLSACAQGYTEGGDQLDFDPDEFGDLIPEDESEVPGKGDGEALVGGLCAMVYDGPEFTGPQTELVPGDIADVRGFGALVVAPTCTVTAEALPGELIAEGYYPASALPDGAVRCDCQLSGERLADLSDSWPGTPGANTLPLFASEPVDLAAIGWSERVVAVEFIDSAAILTATVDAVEAAPGGGAVQPAVIIDPAHDLDGSGQVDLEAELYPSVPARGAPLTSMFRVDVVEVHRTSGGGDVYFAGCEAFECDEALGDDPPSAEQPGLEPPS